MVECTHGLTDRYGDGDMFCCGHDFRKGVDGKVASGMEFAGVDGTSFGASAITLSHACPCESNIKSQYESRRNIPRRGWKLGRRAIVHTSRSYPSSGPCKPRRCGTSNSESQRRRK